MNNVVIDTKEEVIQWMIDTQLGRRNLTPIQRVAIAEKYRPVLKKLAEKNLKQSGENFGKGLQKSSNPIDKPIHTRDELAKIAGVSHDTYGKAKKIKGRGGKMHITIDINNEILKALIHPYLFYLILYLFFIFQTGH